MINEYCAKEYCCEDISKIENYEQAITDTTQTWHCHHKLEIQGEFRNSLELLKKCGLYYNVPAQQLIFLTPGEHMRLHHLGKHHSPEARQKMSESRRGENHPMYGRRGENSPLYGMRRSEAAKQKMREAHLGKPFSEEHKQKLREARCEKLWWNNGVICKMSKDCPGLEWKRGRLFSK